MNKVIAAGLWGRKRHAGQARPREREKIFFVAFCFLGSLVCSFVFLPFLNKGGAPVNEAGWGEKCEKV